MPAAAIHDNRFDALRLLFAGVVAVYHITALAALDTSGRWEAALGFLTEISIQGFFVISGALVLASWERSDHLADYLSKRARRLYPAYAAVVIAAAAASIFVAGAQAETFSYLAANLAFLNFLSPDLPRLFQGQRFEEVNGALWTIKIEVMFYLALPVLAWPLSKLKLRGSLIWLGLIYAGAFVWQAAVLMIFENADLAARAARQMPGQLAYFASGMALHVLTKHLSQSQLLKAAGIGALLFALSFAPLMDMLRPAGLAALIALAAFAPGPRIEAARWGDVSYGVYLVHFPIAQGLIQAGLTGAVYFFSSVLLSLAAAFALWRFVEKPALRRSSHYRRANQGSPA